MNHLARNRTVVVVQPRESGEPAYPLLLASLASTLRTAGWRVVGADGHFDDDGAIRRLIELERPAWIGCTVLPQTASAARALFAPRTHATGARTFVVGGLPAVDPGRALRETGADAAIVTEPESVVVALVDSNVARGSGVPPAGCAVLRGDAVERGPIARRVPLARLPFADRTVFPLLRYARAVRAVAHPSAAVVSSRGCGLACSYCPVDAIRPGGFDARPAAQVHDELERLAREHGVRSVHFEDDNFLRDPARVDELCTLLRERPLPLVWELLNGVRPDQVDAPRLASLAEAGCRRVVFSFEHVARTSPRDVGHALATCRRAVLGARTAGMRVGGYFIVGLPDRTLVETLESLAHAFTLRLDHAKFTPFWAAPGSAYARDAGGGRLLVSPATARALCRVAELAFFAQPTVAARLFRDLAANPALLGTLLRRAAELLRRGGPVPMRS